MKNIFTLLAFCLFSARTMAQTPITIDASNFPPFGLQIQDRTLNPVTNLVPAVNGIWNYSAFHTADTVFGAYFPEFDPFYLDQGIDVYYQDFKPMSANLGYLLYYEYDFDDTGVYEEGLYIDYQPYGIGALTGNPGDSLVFPLQGSVYPDSRRQLWKFPATHQSAWKSNSRRIVAFNLTVTAAGLNKAPGHHVFNISRTDTLLGYGKMRVHTNGTASIPYDVLVNRINQVVTDSFYLFNAPAPSALLTAFGLTQGQISSFNNRYLAFRANNSTPLAVFNYGTNNFTTPSSMFFDNQNLESATDIEEVPEAITTILFPNPSHTGKVALMFLGYVPAYDRYTVLDMEGKIVQTGDVALNENIFNVELHGKLPNGYYLLDLIESKSGTRITEKIQLLRP